MQFTIPQEMTLIEALQHFFPDSSNRTLKQWLEYKRVFVDTALLTNPKLIVHQGQQLEIAPKQETKFFHGINILYQDRWIVVIDKPTNLLSVASEFPDEIHALQIVRAYFKNPSIYAVHRIDKATSGVLLFARGKASEEAFDKMFAEHNLVREYIAIVEGNLISEKGTWKSYLKEQENYDVALSSEEEGGSLAITHYEVTRRSKKFTYLKLRLETGKKHQIRVHCKLAGHPIIGDKRYGSTLNPIERLGLHASLLSFRHPFTGKEVTFTSPLPGTFSKLGL